MACHTAATHCSRTTQRGGFRASTHSVNSNWQRHGTCLQQTAHMHFWPLSNSCRVPTKLVCRILHRPTNFEKPRHRLRKPAKMQFLLVTTIIMKRAFRLSECISHSFDFLQRECAETALILLLVLKNAVVFNNHDLRKKQFWRCCNMVGDFWP